MQGKGCTAATLRLDVALFKGTTFTVCKQVHKVQFRAAHLLSPSNQFYFCSDANV